MDSVGAAIQLSYNCDHVPGRSCSEHGHVTLTLGSNIIYTDSEGKFTTEHGA